jgi:hypothetical protein
MLAACGCPGIESPELEEEAFTLLAEACEGINELLVSSLNRVYASLRRCGVAGESDRAGGGRVWLSRDPLASPTQTRLAGLFTCGAVRGGLESMSALLSAAFFGAGRSDSPSLSVAVRAMRDAAAGVAVAEHIGAAGATTAEAAADAGRAASAAWSARRSRLCRAVSAGLAAMGVSVSAAASRTEAECLRQLQEGHSLLLSEAGHRLWDQHRPWFKGERPGHYVLSWGAALRAQATSIWPMGAAETRHGWSPVRAMQRAAVSTSACSALLSLVADGSSRIAALWGAVRPSRVLMPQLALDTGYCLAATWPIVRLCREEARTVGGFSVAGLAWKGAVHSLWTALWVAGVLCGPAEQVAAVLAAGKDAARVSASTVGADVSAVSETVAESLEGAAVALGVADWASDCADAFASGAWRDRRCAMSLTRGGWITIPDADTDPSPAASGAASGGDGKAGAVTGDKHAHEMIKAAAAVGAGKGYVPPRFGPPPPEDPHKPTPSVAMWEAILTGPCPLAVDSVQALVARRQDMGEWPWPAPTAEDKAAAESLTKALEAGAWTASA